jgi:hypothetical protein
MNEESSRGILKKNCYSDGNYQIMDEESTRRMVILAGITSSGMRHLPEKEIPGNYQREGDSSGNC